VLLLDTSAWTSERTSAGTLLQTEKEMALRYLRRLPVTDKVMLVAADAFTTPLTPFTSDRTQVANALARLQPTYSALHIERALQFASRAENLSDGKEGEVTYIGPQRIQKEENAPPKFSNLRTIEVASDPENCGIRHVGVRRDDRNPSLWKVAVTVENYGKRARSLQLRTKVDGSTVDLHSLSLEPETETVVEYGVIEKGAGSLTIDLKPDDVLPLDNSVTLHLPSGGKTRVAVFTDRADVFKPLLQTDSSLKVTFFSPAQYQRNPQADLVLLDRTAPPEPPGVPSLWIAPPQAGSPVPVRTVVALGVVKEWNSDSNLSAGLRERETVVRDADIFEASPEDITVAGTAEGPVVVARPKTQDGPKLIVLGFDPVQDEARLQPTVPLLFANLFKWLAPGPTESSELEASVVGSTVVPISSSAQLADLHVSDATGKDVPYAIHNRLLEFFTDYPSLVTIHSEDAIRTLSPVLPDVAEKTWVSPVNARAGLPQAAPLPAAARDLWKWLAAAGGLGLLTEWFLFGRRRNARLGRVAHPFRLHSNVSERELVDK
jgi:hypothetical protein